MNANTVVGRGPGCAVDATQPGRFAQSPQSGGGSVRARIRTVIVIASMLVVAGLAGSGAQAGDYKTDKWDKREDLREGGWYVAFGAEMTESDLLRGIVAGAVDIYTGSTVALKAWFEELLQRTMRGIKRMFRQSAEYLRGEAEREIRAWLYDQLIEVVRGKRADSREMRFSRLDVKAGVVQYSGANRQWVPNLSREGGYWLTVSTTVAWQTYLAIRIHDPLEREGAEGLPRFDAAVRVDDEKAFFFAGKHYYRFDFGEGHFDKRGVIGIDGFKGLWGDRGVDAAIRDVDGRHLFFFKGGEYKRWVIGDGVDKTGKIGDKRFVGLWTDGIDAALTHPNGNYYFFKGNRYLRWTPGEGVTNSGVIGNGGWKGLWAEGVDAAVDHPNGRIYFFRGGEYLRWEPGEGVDKRGRTGITGWRVVGDD